MRRFFLSFARVSGGHRLSPHEHDLLKAAGKKGWKKGVRKSHANRHARKATDACAVDFSKPYRPKGA